MHTVLARDDGGRTLRVFGRFRVRADAERAGEELKRAGVYEDVWVQHDRTGGAGPRGAYAVTTYGGKP